MALRRLGAWSGLALAALLAASYVLGGPMPRAGTPPTQLLVFLRAHSETQEWSWFLLCGPGLIAGPWFLGALSARLWAADQGRRELVAAGFGSGLIAGALLAAAGVTWGLFVYLGTQITNGSLLLLLAESRHFAEGSISFPAAGAVIAFTLAARGRLPAWRLIAVLGAAAAGLQLANGVYDFAADGVTGALGPASFAALLAWLIGTSLALVPGAASLPSPRETPAADRLLRPPPGRDGGGGVHAGVAAADRLTRWATRPAPSDERA
ncbi:MAG TPA: hypothetical protein VF137_03060 [Candidatus Dormibacteraeota bacterium]